MQNHIEELSEHDLALVAGGGWLGNTLRFGGKVASKVLWPVRVGVAAYNGYQGYAAARAKGKGVAESLGAGVQNAASEETFGIIPPPQ